MFINIKTRSSKAAKRCIWLSTRDVFTLCLHRSITRVNHHSIRPKKIRFRWRFTKLNKVACTCAYALPVNMGCLLSLAASLLSESSTPFLSPNSTGSSHKEPFKHSCIKEPVIFAVEIQGQSCCSIAIANNEILSDFWLDLNSWSPGSLRLRCPKKNFKVWSLTLKPGQMLPALR